MTYCLSLLCREGIVFISDSRTSAGVDNINVRPKMRIYSQPGDRVVCLMTSGNLSVTQSVLALIDEDALRAHSDANVPHLMNQPTMFETARYVGSVIRRVAEMDRAALERDGLSFNINVIVGGQIGGLAPQIHFVYPQGNSLQANVESPFLQIGEYKYGKPVLDRGFTFETKLSDAVKFGVLSMEATVKSNVSVGGPFDVFVYERDSLEVKLRRRLEETDPYFRTIQKKWGDGIVRLVEEIPGLEFSPLAQ
jgi:putative proteasome-type protease